MMEMKLVIILSCLAVAVFAVPFQDNPGVAMRKLPTNPNIVFFFMDDMGWGDPGCYGNEARETPNIDKLAAEGALFTDFYSGYPMCSPSRTALLTGRLPIRTGCYTDNNFGRNAVFFPNVTGGLKAEEETLAEILGARGYVSKVIGKWHLGNSPESFPLDQGFDEFFGSNANHFGPHDNINTPNVEVYRDRKMAGRYFEDEFFLDLDTGESDLTRLWTEDALDFIDRMAKPGQKHTTNTGTLGLENNGRQPFFLYWAADATHTPLGAAKEFLGTSQRGLYGDVVRDLDHGIGQIMEKLKEHNLDKNTFVFFSSDNGPAGYQGIDSGSSGPFVCSKITTYEGGMRIPAIFRWPGFIPSGQIEREPSTVMDVFHTVLEITDTTVSNPDRPLDGRSLWETLSNGVDDIDNKEHEVYYYRGNGLYAVRVGDYKAHYWTWNVGPMVKEVFGSPCTGDFEEGFVTDDIRDHNDQPWVFHLGRDPYEKYAIEPHSDEWNAALATINAARARHYQSLEGDIGAPQLNFCDPAVYEWSPVGCEELGKCLPPAESNPVLCNWFF